MTMPSSPVLVVLDQSNAYQSRVVVGMRATLEAERIPLLLVARDPFEFGLTSRLERALDALQPRGVIACTLDTPEADEHLQAVLAARPNLSVVHIGSHLSGCSVRANNSVGMEEIVRHLIVDCGVRRPVVVRGIVHQPDSVEREEVLRKVFAEHGITLDETLFVDGHFHRDNAYRKVSELLRERRDMDAVIAFNDRSALGAMEAVTEAGLRIPLDVVVTGFDDDALSAFARPPLTTVTQDAEKQGALAADMLLRLIAGEKIGDVRVPTRVILRESSRRSGGRRPIESDLVPRQAIAPAAFGRPSRAASTGGGLWDEVADLDTTLAMTRAFMRCASVSELVNELASALPRLKIARCFVVLLRSPSEHSSSPSTAARENSLGTVALAYAPGLLAQPVNHQPFDTTMLLPPELADQLHQGTLTMQPLSTESRQFGYLLIQQQNADRFVGDALRMDVSRSLESLARATQLAEHAQTLEALVAARTRELEAEVLTRRRAEDELMVHNEELRTRLHIDGLTGICNRVGFDVTLDARWREHGRSRSPLSLLMVDADNFKQFNDAHGHLAGDDCLRALADCLRRATHRPQDLAARYGGDEFALILPDTPLAGALLIAERIRSELLAAAGSDAYPYGLVTVSIGAATMYPDPTPRSASLVARADTALYAAKAAGRDRAVGATEDALVR